MKKKEISFNEVDITRDFTIVGKVLSGHDDTLFITTKNFKGNTYQTLAVKGCKRSTIESLQLNKPVVVKGVLSTWLKSVPESTKRTHAQVFAANEIIPYDNIQEALKAHSQYGHTASVRLAGKVVYCKAEGGWMRMAIGGTARPDARYQSVFISALKTVVPNDLKPGDLIDCVCLVKAAKSSKVEGLIFQDLTATHFKRFDTVEEFENRGNLSVEKHSAKKQTKSSNITSKAQIEKKKAAEAEAKRRAAQGINSAEVAKAAAVVRDTDNLTIDIKESTIPSDTSDLDVLF